MCPFPTRARRQLAVAVHLLVIALAFLSAGIPVFGALGRALRMLGSGP